MGRPLSPKIVFMGSPRFAAVILERLVESGMTPLAVFTQEDKTGDRGHKVIEPDVKTSAKKAGIPVFQPKKLKDPEVVEELRKLAPDLLIVAAYGKILPKEILEIPKIACVNVHASILPRWRGASPVHHAILSGDKATGVSIMKMEEGLDTGPVYLYSDETEIGKNETAGELTERLARTGAELLPYALEKICKGECEPVKQDDSLATYAPRIKKEDGAISFDKNSHEIERMVRAFQPWPKAHFIINGARISVLEAEPGAEAGGIEAGTALSSGKLWFSCGGSSSIIFRKIQREGKKPLNSEEFLR